jgi:hypothetical protein
MNLRASTIRFEVAVHLFGCAVAAVIRHGAELVTGRLAKMGSLPARYIGATNLHMEEAT